VHWGAGKVKQFADYEDALLWAKAMPGGADIATFVPGIGGGYKTLYPTK